MAANQIQLADFDQIAVVANDAGGAEVLSAYVKQHAADYRYCVTGPAAAVFQRKVDGFKNLPLADAVGQAGVLLCGSGWQTDLELEAIRLTRSEGKHSICWLDHWVNYRNRFVRDGVATFPDELWLCDNYALDIAHKELPELPAFIQANPYFQEILVELGRTAPSLPELPGQLSLLYLCEPIGDHAAIRYGNRYHWGYTEKEALQYFLDHLQVIGSNIGRILIRPHPSEKADKYQSLLAGCSVPVFFSNQSTLLADLACSDCVVGSNSMAMIVAQLIGKRVISCIPSGGAQCSLPHKEIERLEGIIRAQSLQGSCG